MPIALTLYKQWHESHGTDSLYLDKYKSIQEKRKQM